MDATAPVSDLTILVAEDDPDIREILEMLLADAGYRVLTAVDGIDALDLARGARLDLILVDAGMPRLDGAGFCRAYREDGGTTPVILISASDSAVITATVTACGAVAYISKPFDIGGVLDKIVGLIGSR